MAYFPNATSGEAYEAAYCDKCVHQYGPSGNGGCSVMLLHLLYNYDECNKPQSFLHTLIPQTEDGLGAKECTMFFDKAWDKRATPAAPKPPGQG